MATIDCRNAELVVECGRSAWTTAGNPRIDLHHVTCRDLDRHEWGVAVHCCGAALHLSAVVDQCRDTVMRRSCCCFAYLVCAAGLVLEQNH